MTIGAPHSHLSSTALRGLVRQDRGKSIAKWVARQPGGKRGLYLQGLIIVAITGAVLLAVSVAASRLESMHMGAGFGFLLRPAGVAIPDGWVTDTPSDSFLRLIAAGLANTVTMAAVIIPLATAVGLIVGLLRLSANPLLRLATGIYVGLFRTTPALLQILVWAALLLHLPAARRAVSLGNFAVLSQRGLQLPTLVTENGYVAVGIAAVAASSLAALRGLRIGGSLAKFATLLIAAVLAWSLGAFALQLPARRGLGIEGGSSLAPEFIAIVFGLTLYFGAFIAEVVRGSVQSVPRAQTETAQSLGLSRVQVLRSVVLPQAAVTAIPPLTIQYSSIVKSTSLAIAIGYPELFWSISATINNTGHAFEGVAALMLAYLTITLSVAAVMDRLNHRLLRRIGS